MVKVTLLKIRALEAVYAYCSRAILIIPQMPAGSTCRDTAGCGQICAVPFFSL